MQHLQSSAWAHSIITLSPPAFYQTIYSEPLLGLQYTKHSFFVTSNCYKSFRWIGLSLSVAATTLVMQLTGIIHSPAGITALLPATEYAITELSWYYLPMTMLSSTYMVFCFKIVNKSRSFTNEWFWEMRNDTLHSEWLFCSALRRCDIVTTLRNLLLYKFIVGSSDSGEWKNLKSGKCHITLWPNI